MKFSTFIIALVVVLNISINKSEAQSKYYFSISAGNDSRTSAQAQNPATPWKTISKLNSFTGFTPGDSILLKRGETWRESMIVPASGTSGNPIKISSYGTGSLPVINCLPRTSNWSSPVNGVYTASQKIDALGVVYEDGIPLVPMASSAACTDGRWYGNNVTTFAYRPTSGTANDHIITTVRVWSMFTAGIDVSSRNYITIDGLQFDACPAGVKGFHGTASAPGTATTLGIKVRNCTFNYNVNGVFFMPDAGNNTNAVIDHNTFYRNQCGVRMYSTVSNGIGTSIGCTISNNEIIDCGTTNGTSLWNSGPDYESIGLQNIENCTISNNYIHGGYTLATTIWLPANTVASGNTITGNKVENTQRHGFVMQGKNEFTTANYAFNNNTVTNNLYINCGSSGFKQTMYLAQGANTTQMNYIYNNTLVGDYSKIYIANTKPAYLTIKNNIISGSKDYRISTYGAVPTHLIIDYERYNESPINDKYYFNGTYSLASLQSTLGFETHGHFGDPSFDPNHHLLAGSQCIDAGVDVGLPFTGIAPDIGAFEFTSVNNQPPSILNQTFQIAENSANGTLVGTVVASDPDAGQTLTFSILSGNTSGAFGINASTGVLSVANSAALNFEVTSSFALVVKIQDNGTGTLSNQATITVNLLNVNEPPVVNNQTFSVLTMAPNATLVGTVSATDPDAGEILSFAITSGNTGSAFAINSLTGKISVANSAAVNFSTNPIFSLKVRVTDNGVGNLYTDATITINVLQGTNQPPVIANQSFSVNENSANGTLVGTVVASDPDAGEILTFSILSGNTSGAFAINASTGVLSVANSAALNFEVTSSFALVVKVQDNGTGTLSNQATITVNLLNVNEPPVVNNQTFSVLTMAPNATLVGTVSATDPDAGEILSFAITSGNTGSAFAINSLTGKISVANSAAVNFSTNPIFSLKVRVTDNGVGNLYTDATITINVLQGTNQPPVIANQSFSVNENSANGTLVGTVVASDPDAGEILTFSILSGNTSGAFAINASTGVLSVANSAVLNFEVTPSFALVVKVQDNGTGTLSNQATMTVNLLNVNEPPIVNNQTFSVLTMAPNTTLVGTVSATDPDAGEILSFAITSGNTGSAFAINSLTGKISVANSAAVNFSTNPIFSLKVRVTDNGVGNLYTDATITINVLQGTNQPPVIANQSFSVNENSANGTLVGTVVASDPDAGEILTFSILSGNTSGAFVINASTGVLSVANSAVLNFEVTPSFALVVKVQDNGTGTLSAQATITVNLLNVNEPPVVNNQTFSVLTMAPNGTLVGTVSATDPDAGEILSFAITSGNTGSAFSINSLTGKISVANSAAVNFQTNPTFSLKVRVTDNGSGNLYTDATITINVLQGTNQPPVIAIQSFSVNENSANGTLVGTVVASDPDAGEILTFSILSGNTSGAFAINASTGVLSVANSAVLNFEVTPSFALVVKVQDNGTGTLSNQAKITITLREVSQSPEFNNQVFDLPENSGKGTIISPLLAKNPNIGQTLKFSIAEGNTGNTFSLDTTTGILSVANPTLLIYTSNPEFNLKVIVQDNGTKKLSTSAIVTIHIKPENKTNPLTVSGSLVHVSIYPNPTAGIITIGLEDAGDQEADIRILDMLGSTIISTMSNGQKKVVINLENQKTGVYLAIITIHGQVISRKIIVQAN